MPDIHTTMPSSPKPQSDPTTSVLFHLGYTFPSPFLSTCLRHVRYVLLCGSLSRAHNIASHFRAGPHTDLCRTDRYTLLQPHAEILVAAHGIGTGSIDVLLHELHIALRAATGGCAYTLLRIGSCGGVGVASGSVVVSRRVLNGLFEPCLRLAVLGEQRKLGAEMDAAVGDELERLGRARLGGLCVRGDTMSAETFYVAQGRRDGAFAEFSAADRMRFLRECQRKGVVNFEMESVALGAFAKRVGVAAATVCAVLVNRLEQETPVESEDVLAAYQERAVQLVVEYVRDKVGCEKREAVCAGINGAVCKPAVGVQEG